jgi:D-alanyl-lipoteichoic acid acyltransferase DltB (MBOAT superfamily)
MNVAKFWLVALSFLFYGWWNLGFLILLVGSILFNFVCGYLIQVNLAKERIASLLLVAGLSVNLGVLFYFKYALTLFDWLHSLGLYQGPSWGTALLPLGISFFTFTQIGYLIDAKGGKAREKGFMDFVLFVTFFPHLISGPILHHGEIMPQFAQKETYRFNGRNLAVGFSIFILGLAKKVLIADHCATVSNFFFLHAADDHINDAWIGALAYSLQLYFDFSGYSEMALGLARMFNVKFPANFDSPYKSKNIIEFWQRWHISLTRFMTLYLYNPLSLWIMRRRAAQGLAMLKAEETTFEGFMKMLAMPTLYTMFLIGLWHGAGFQFIIFGLLHGTYLCINHAWRMFGPKAPKTPGSPLASFFSGAWKWALTYLSVLVAEIFFRAKGVGEAWTVIKAMAGWGPWKWTRGTFGLDVTDLPHLAVAQPSFYTHWWLYLVLLFTAILCLPNILQIFEKEQPSFTKLRSAPAFLHFEWRPNMVWGFMLGGLFLIALLLGAGTTEFLYYRF